MFLRTAHRQPTIANGESPSQAFANNGATTSLKLNRKSKEPKGFLKVPTNALGNRGMASATSGMAKGPDATTLLSPPPATQHRRRSVLRPHTHRVPPIRLRATFHPPSSLVAHRASCNPAQTKSGRCRMFCSTARSGCLRESAETLFAIWPQCLPGGRAPR